MRRFTVVFFSFIYFLIGNEEYVLPGKWDIQGVQFEMEVYAVWCCFYLFFTVE